MEETMLNINKLTDKQKRKMVKDDYDAIANLYAAEDRNLKFYSTYIDKFLNGLKGKLVLDACCGAGDFSNYIASKGNNVIAVDFSKELIDIARLKFNNVNFVIDDICDFKSKQNFDGIFSKDSLFHLPDKDLEKVLNNFYDILNENGKLLLILDIPNEAGEKIYTEPLNENFSLYYNYLSIDKIKSALTKSKFKIDEINVVNDSVYVYAQGVMFVYASK